MNVAEKFISVNGEGMLAGQLAVFVRFKLCNLSCGYCDTKWANKNDNNYTQMSPEEILRYVLSTGIQNVTLTGGEPLLQTDMYTLLKLLANENLHVEIETNGSIDISPFCGIKNRPSFTLDYKLPSSGMEGHMLVKNYDYIDKRDCVKFVAGSFNDLERAREIIDKYKLIKKTNVIISPVFGTIDLFEYVEFMKLYNMNGVKLQLQLHKYIWNPNERGV